jgi:peptidyl-prolyl cis-trans isomerase SurA
MQLPTRINAPVKMGFANPSRTTDTYFYHRNFMFKALKNLLPLLVFGLAAAPVLSQETPIDSIVAVVNDDIILASDFIAERAQLIRQSPPDLPRGDALDKAVMERLIVQSLQLQSATQRGIRIDDNSLQRAIEDMARNNNMSVERMRATLSEEGVNFLEFRENVRKELIISTLSRRVVESNLSVSEAEVEELLSVESGTASTSRYELDHILVQVPQQADADLIATAERIAQDIASQARDGIPFNRLIDNQRALGNNNVEGSNLGARTLTDMPPLFANTARGMQVDDVSEPLRSAAGFHVIKLLRKVATVAEPSRVRARHILASTRSGRSSQDARALIDNVRNQLIEGRDFAALAAQFSEDTSTAANGGDLGWFGRGEMVAPFEARAFTSAVNQVTEPFETSFGWHILEVLDQEINDAPRAAQRSRAREQLRRRKAEEKFQNWLTELRENAYVELRGFAKNFQ